MVIVPVELAPPTRDVGFRAIFVIVGAAIGRLPLTVVVPRVADTLAT
jgi:hypothetical protein